MKILRLKYVAAIFCFLFSIAKTNAQWSELGGSNTSPFNNWINCITTDVNGNIYAAGGFTNDSGKYYVAKWNGSAWEELGGKNKSTFNQFIASIVTDAKGNLYAGGYFRNSNNNYYIAKWDGAAWSELGGTNTSTFNGLIASIIVDANSNVYVAGNFTNTNFYWYVAKWNGVSWSELDGSNKFYYSDCGVSCISIDAHGNLYAAKNLGNCNGNYCVAKWNGSEWVQLGKSFNNGITITTDINGNLYAGGWFTHDTSFSNGKYYVAKWNGSSWGELGGNNISTFNGSISCITTDTNGYIYTSGYFTDGNNNSYIAKWTGNTWGKLGDSGNDSGFNGLIHSITIDKYGYVYTAGNFTNGTIAFNGHQYVAKYGLNTLHLKLTYINSIQQGKTIQTNWHTYTELNTSHFIIQHSTDGSSFTNIGTVKAIGSGANGYSFTDNNPTNGINYYRLKSVDKDGGFTFSKAVSVQLTVDRLTLTVTPNPARDIVTVKGNHIVSVQVVDNMGKVIKTQTLKDATNPTLSVGGLPVGVYHLRILTTDGKVSGVGFVKQ